MTEKILVIKLGALGDIILVMGHIRAIRRHHPTAHISILTRPAYEELFKKSGLCDEVIIDCQFKIFQVICQYQFLKRLKEYHFDRVYDLQNNDRTKGYFFFLKYWAKEWVGSVVGATYGITDTTRHHKHALFSHTENLKLAGISNIEIDDLAWMEPVNNIRLPVNSVLLVAGCAPSRPQKRWPAGQYRQIAERLIENGYHPVLIGTKAERDVNSFIANGLNVTDLTEKTHLYDLPFLARQARGAIGNDTGPIHVLAVTGIPVLALFDSRQSTVALSAPQGKNAKTIEVEDLSALTVERVWDVFLPLLGTTSLAEQAI
jgi:ADP-heptose:LPS heptosyltransferase